MQTLIANASGYDWNTWKMGILRAAVSGAANGMIAFAINVGWEKTLALVIGSVVVSIGTFLKTHPAPDPFQQALENAAKSLPEAK